MVIKRRKRAAPGRPSVTLEDAKLAAALPQGAAQAFGLVLEGNVSRYPAESRDWTRLELPGAV